MTKEQKAPETLAIHATHPDGEHHGVAVLNLHVLIVQDGKHWFAQGLEIDYAAQGDSVDEAKLHFQKGFKSSLYHNLRIFGNIDKFLRVAPNEVWQEYFSTPKAQKLYSHVSMHEVIPQVHLTDLPQFQYEQIEYAQAAMAAAA